jgi:DNA-binding NarL/FixJ family response regulator
VGAITTTDAMVGAVDHASHGEEHAVNGVGVRSKSVRVLVADDDAFARRMIRDALERADLAVVAEAQNGHDAVRLCLRYRPDVVVMDVVMPEIDGIAATRRIVKELPRQRVVMLTSTDEQEMGFLGLRAGAVGFLSKEIDIDSLPRALRAAVAGEAVLSRQMGMRLVEHLQSTPDGTSGLRPVKSPLTAREWEVIDLLAECMTTEQIAEALVLAPETVRSHVKNILRKLNARSRGEAVKAAQRLRLRAATRER